MILSFANKDTERLYRSQRVRWFPSELVDRGRKKLLQLEAATDLEDLRTPPANRLETLLGDRKGQYSIRINDRYRLCFRWTNGDAYDVEIVDYH